MSNYIYEDQLESPRLCTRYLTADDIPTWKKFFDDPDSSRFLNFHGFSDDMERTTHWINRQMQRYKEKLFGLQAILLRETGELIGLCGLLAQEVEGEMVTEVGYHVLKEYRGHGYAPEAAKIFIDYAFKNKLTSTVISIIDVNNFNSQRVAEKNGLIRSRQLQWNGMDIYIYKIEAVS